MRIGTWVNKRVGLGLLLSVLLCVVGAALGALLESKELLEESQEGVWMCVTWAVAAFAGCRFSLQNTEGRLTHIAVQGALLYLAVWCGALAAGTDMQFRTNGWYITACIWGGAGVSAILPEGKKKKRRRRTAGKHRSRKGRQ